MRDRRGGGARRASSAWPRRLGLPPTEVRVGHPRRRQREHGGAARVHIAERGRDPARLRAALHRRRRARCTPATVARKLGLAPRDLPAVGGRGLRARAAGGAGARRPRGHGRASASTADSVAALEAAFRRLEDEARAVMADTGLKLETATRAAARRRPLPRPGLRSGRRPCPTGPTTDADGRRARALTAAFEAAYREKFALTPPDVPVEFINIRVAVRAPVAGSDGGAARARRAAAPAARSRAPPRVLPRGAAASWRRRCTTARASASATRFAGPAVVEEEGSTLVSGPGATRARGGPSGNLVDDARGRRAAMTHPASTPITLEVLWTRIISVVDEAAKAIVRTSFSTLSNEANDFACVLTDARGLRAGAEHAAASRPSSAPCPPPCATSCARSAPQRMRPGRRAHHQRPVDGHRAHERRLRASSRSSSDGPPGGLLGDHLAHAGHRRAHPRHRGARGVRGGLPHPAHQADARGRSRTRRCSS